MRSLWAGLIVLLVLIITSPGDHVAAGVLIAWAALTAVLVATTRLVPWEGCDWGWQRVVGAVVWVPAMPLIAAGSYVWRRTQPFRRSRADRRDSERRH